MFAFLFILDIAYVLGFVIYTKNDSDTTPMSNEEYDSLCKSVGFMKILPFLIGLGIFVILCFVDMLSDEWIFSLFFMLASGWSSCICASIGSAYLVKLADRREVPKDNPNIAYQAKEHVMGTASLIGGAASVAKNAKKRTKELMDVEHWDTMK